MQDQPDVYPRVFKMQQQLGGGGKYKPPKQSKKELKKQKEDEERQRELYDLQRAQIKQAEADAARANRAAENQNEYQAMLSRADQNLLSYVAPYDPTANYKDPNYRRNTILSAQSKYKSATAKEAAATAAAQKKEQAAAAAQKKQTEEIIKAQTIAPLPTSYSLDAEEASQGARRKEKRRIGLGVGTIFAGETGGYDTSKKTLLG